MKKIVLSDTRVLPPKQWKSLVLRSPEYTTVTTTRCVVEKLDLKKYNEIFQAVKMSMKYQRDEVDVWGKPSRVRGIFKRWIMAGDCDDFAVEYSQRLMIEGVPYGAMRFIVCQTELKQMHLVLCVDSQEDSLIFDNRMQAPQLISSDVFRGYAWIICSNPGEYNWRKIAGYLSWFQKLRRKK